VNRGTMGVNSLPKTVTRQRRDCDLNPGPSAPESSTLTTRLQSHPIRHYAFELQHVYSSNNNNVGHIERDNGFALCSGRESRHRNAFRIIGCVFGVFWPVAYVVACFFLRCNDTWEVEIFG